MPTARSATWPLPVLAAVVLLALFAATTAAEHAVRPALSPVTHRVSEYANGPGGATMTLAFAAWTASLVLTARALWWSGPRPTAARRGAAAALALAALGAGVLVVCHTGTVSGRIPAGRVLTTENHWHNRGAGGLALALWAAVLLTSTAQDRVLRRRTLVALGSGVALAAVLSPAVVDAPGVRQRALLAVAVAWQLAVLSALREPSLNRRPGSGCRRARSPSSTS